MISRVGDSGGLIDWDMDSVGVVVMDGVVEWLRVPEVDTLSEKDTEKEKVPLVGEMRWETVFGGVGEATSECVRLSRGDWEMVAVKLGVVLCE